MHKPLERLAAGCAALCLTLCGLRLLLPFCVYADVQPETVAAEILAAQADENVQQWIDSTLAAAPAKGANDWYALALAAAGSYDLQSYADALTGLAEENPGSSATSRERIALTLLACADEPPAVCETLLRDSIGKQGIMSWVFGLHLLNNGIPADTSVYEAVTEIISRQCADGGFAVTGQYGDPDVTAMALQALAPYQHTEPVAGAVERALDFLSQKQLASGAYSSFGTENPESTAQVWLALQSLGISALEDARFIKSGSLLDGIMQFSLGNGQFAHTAGGSANETAAVQVFLALTADACSHPFYLFHGAAPELTVPVTTAAQSTAAVTQTAAETRLSDTQTAVQSSPQTAQTATAPEAVSTAAETTASAAEAPVTLTAASSAAQTQTFSEHTAGTQTEAETSRTHTETAVQTTVTAENAPPPSAKYPYRMPVTVGMGTVFLIGSAVMFLRKNRSAKSYLTLLVFCGGVTALAWILKIETPAQYYQQPEKSGAGGSVTMAIRCDVILGLPGAEAYPADGVILPETEFALDENDTALDILYDAVKTYGLQIEVDGVSGDVIDNAYVRGIASLYEFDFGELSGWTYTVNGERPSVGAGAFPLHDGDTVIWAYTVTL